MLLLTWHGTLVCRHAGGLVHLPLPAADALDLPVPEDWRALPADGVPLDAGELGTLLLRPARLGRGVSLSRGADYLCAERGQAAAVFNRPEANQWESLLPVTSRQAADLSRIVGRRWLVRDSRRVVPRDSVRLGDEFVLHWGESQLDLLRFMPLCQPARLAPASGPALASGLALASHTPLASARASGSGSDPASDHALPPAVVVLPGDDAIVELVAAEPRSSALLHTETWPVRARRVAEMLALATHRGVHGHEPSQHAFERDVTFLLGAGGPAALEDLLERSLARARASQPTPDATPPADAQPLCPVVSLGTTCVVAAVLRRFGINQAPMPFDWLTSTPAMIRHCIETEFAVLADPAQHVSLTGQANHGEPDEGAVHLAYREAYGIGRVFNHSDPTRPGGRRYLQACIDRFADLAAQPGPKLFVQLRGASEPAEFAETARLLDSAVPEGVLLQVLVDAPDRRRVLPLLDVTARAGNHVQYTMRPLSQLWGERFEDAADELFLAKLIRAHASLANTPRAAASRARAALHRAYHRFGEEAPEYVKLPASGVAPPVVHLGNLALHRFLSRAGLARRFEFGAFDPGQARAELGGGALLVTFTGNRASLQVDLAETDRVWQRLQRALAAVYVMDALLADGPVPDTSFLLEVGDTGYAERSACFCSPRPGACLLPDQDFIGSGGYEDLRREAALHDRPWQDRAPVVFWRGATTGQLRHAPPGPDAPDDLTWLPRLDLCARAARSPIAGRYDVGISNIVQVSEPHLVARIEASGLMRGRVPHSAFFGHKWLLVIDGNSNAWSALFAGLLRGSCVLKVASPKGFKQWYYDRLKPWVHFVPVEEDLSDLDELVAWLEAHDDDAQAIGKAGRAFAEALTFEAVVADSAARLRAWLSK